MSYLIWGEIKRGVRTSALDKQVNFRSFDARSLALRENFSQSGEGGIEGVFE